MDIELINALFDNFRGDGEIDLLPALPDAWAQGAVDGLRARAAA